MAVLPQGVEVCRTHTVLMNLEKDRAGQAWTTPFHTWSLSPLGGTPPGCRGGSPFPFSEEEAETCPLPMSNHLAEPELEPVAFSLVSATHDVPATAGQAPPPLGSPQCTC